MSFTILMSNIKFYWHFYDVFWLNNNGFVIDYLGDMTKKWMVLWCPADATESHCDQFLFKFANSFSRIIFQHFSYDLKCAHPMFHAFQGLQSCFLFSFRYIKIVFSCFSIFWKINRLTCSWHQKRILQFTNLKSFK